MKVLITGATGFVGSRLVKYLVNHHKPYEISILVRKNSSLEQLEEVRNELDIFEYSGEIHDLIDFLTKANPEIVIHVASCFISEHKEDQVDQLIDSNIKFPTQLLEAMSKCSIKKFINTGTSWEYFESDEYNPVNLYASTKHAFEQISQYYSEVHGTRFIHLKLFDTFGQGDPRKKIVALLKRISETGETLDMSPGEQEINLVHIDDVCEAYGKAIDLIGKSSYKQQTYGISTDEIIPLKEFVELYSSVNEVNLDINWGGKPYRTREVLKLWRSYDRLPDWTPKVSLKEGLKGL